MAHKVEVAPSGRAACRGCKQPIAKGTPRLAEEFANQFADDGGTSFRYWHLACAAPKLANELQAALAAYEGAIDDRASLDALIAEHLRPPMPYAELASTGRARCRACDETIPKGALRVAFERTIDSPMGPQKSAAYAHAGCLPRYLAREKELGRETPELGVVLRWVRAHSKLSEHDLARVEDEARTAAGGHREP
jgi:hypothetical protein